MSRSPASKQKVGIDGFESHLSSNSKQNFINPLVIGKQELRKRTRN